MLPITNVFSLGASCISCLICCLQVQLLHFVTRHNCALLKGLAFIVVICYFSVDAIAVELSDPFGDDANDLPLDDIMEDYNRQLSQVLPKQTKVRSTSVVGEERDPTVHQPLTLIEQNDTEWLKNNQAKIQQVLRMCHIQDLEHRKFHSEVRLDNSGPIGHAALRE